MKHIGARIEIAAPAASVWRLIAEFEHWPAWGPTVRAVESSAATVAPGVKGRVRTPLGLWLPFEVTTVEHERCWEWKVAGVPATGHELRVVDPRRTEVRFTAPWAFGFYAPVLRSGLRRLRALAEAG